MFRLLSSNRGMALPMVLVVIVIFVMFSSAILAMGTVDTRASVYDSNKARAYYYAHSGAEAVGSYIVENPDNLSSGQMKNLVDRLVKKGESLPFRLSDSDEGIIKVNVNRSDNIISIISTAEYQGTRMSVTLNIEEKVAAGEPFDKAVYSVHDITIDQGATIEGSIAGLANINYLNGTVEGKVYIRPGADSSVVNHPDWIHPTVVNLDEIFEYDEFPFPEYPDYPVGLPTVNQPLNLGWNQSAAINNDLYYTKGINLNNGRLEIIRNNTNRILRTKYLRISGTGQVNDIRSGNGKLEIYIDDDLEVSSDTKLVFDLGDGDIVIRVRRLLLNQGHIVVNHRGKGKLYIYVDDVLHLGGSSQINYISNATEEELMARSRKVFLYYAGTRDNYGNDITDPGNENYLGFPQNIRIVATVQVKEAKIHVANGSGIVGNIISGGREVKFDGGTNTVARIIYAPNARVYVGGGAKITGVIISDTFEINGGARIVHADVDQEDLEYFEEVIGRTTYSYHSWQ